jgi:RNA-dependent RNA polymerase
LGIPTDAFLKYQEEAIKSVDPEELFTLDGALFVLEHFQLGTASRLKRLLRSLVELGVDGDIVQQEPFLRYSLESVRARFFRDLKNKASIPLPDCYQLVGVPDEGMTVSRYIFPFYSPVCHASLVVCEALLTFTILTDRFLAPEEVYICIRRPEAPDSPLYLEGKIVLTRSPVVDPGDVRVVRAVGRLPERSRLRMKALENCVVLSSRGSRPLSSLMGGGGASSFLLFV